MQTTLGLETLGIADKFNVVCILLGLRASYGLSPGARSPVRLASLWINSQN